MVLIVGLLALLVVAVAGWGVALLFGLTIREYVAGILPTFVGIVAGLPLAQWLIRVGEDVSAQRDAEAGESRRRLVVGVIRDELQQALDDLRSHRAARPRELFFPFLKTEAWRALADGGELRWVDDPDLIGRIARAYDRIDSTTILERAIFEFANDPVLATIRFKEGVPNPLEELLKLLAAQDEHTIAAIDYALEAIHEALGEPRVTPNPTP